MARVLLIYGVRLGRLHRSEAARLAAAGIPGDQTLISLVEHIKAHGLWLISLAYAGVSVALLAIAWTLIVEIAGFSPLYVHLLAVFSVLGLPLALGLAWAIREPTDPAGKGHVVRD